MSGFHGFVFSFVLRTSSVFCCQHFSTVVFFINLVFMLSCQCPGLCLPINVNFACFSIHRLLVSTRTLTHACALRTRTRIRFVLAHALMLLPCSTAVFANSSARAPRRSDAYGMSLLTHSCCYQARTEVKYYRIRDVAVLSVHALQDPSHVHWQHPIIV